MTLSAALTLLEKRLARAWSAGFVTLVLACTCAPAFAAIEPAFEVGGFEAPSMDGSARLQNAMRRVSAATNDDLQSALAAVQKMANAGDAQAAFRLGRYYHLESGHPDYVRALTLYKQAMAHGNAWAMNNIGLLYRDGTGVQQDYPTARAYFERSAATKRNPFGFYNLALMSLEGYDGPPNVQLGLAWLDKCAALNMPLCLYVEAALYYTGDYGVPVDYAKTMALGTRASNLGDRAATWGIAKLYLLGQGTHEDVTKGMDLMRSLSDQGYAKATGSLGELYADDKIRNEFFDGTLEGEDRVPRQFKAAVRSDVEKAIGYWETAAQRGNCHSLLDLSSIYDRGAGVPTDYSKGAKYVEDAVKCEPNNSYYVWKLAKRLEEAKGLPKDCVAASQLFVKSMVLGYSDAAVDLGYIFDKGCDAIRRDDKRALQIYLAGAKAGVPLCQNNVGAMLKHGRGIGGTPDTIRGYAWLTLAANNGDELAVKNLVGYQELFPEGVRKQGLQHLEEIKKMIHPGEVDMQLLASGDMSY